MAFRVKDLMINVLPREGEGGGLLSRFPCGHCGCTWGYTQGCGPTVGGGGTQTFMMMMTCTQLTMGCTAEGSFTPHPRCPPASYYGPQCTADMSVTIHPTTLLAISPLCCLPWSAVAGPVGVPPAGDPAAMVEQLAAMKAQLREAIAQIEAQEKIVSDLAQPQSEAEINELQDKLKDALNELERRKSELKKKQ